MLKESVSANFSAEKIVMCVSVPSCSILETFYFFGIRETKNKRHSGSIDRFSCERQMSKGRPWAQTYQAQNRRW